MNYFYKLSSFTQVPEAEVRNKLRLTVAEILPEHLEGSNFCIVSDAEIPECEQWEQVNESFEKLESGIYRRVLTVVNHGDAIELRKKHIAEKRYEVEVGGVAIGELTIPTDRNTQQVLSAMYIRALNDENYSVNFKTATGFAQLDSAQIIQIAIAVHDHIQAAFAREAELLMLLDDELVSGYDW